MSLRCKYCQPRSSAVVSRASRSDAGTSGYWNSGYAGARAGMSAGVAALGLAAQPLASHAAHSDATRPQTRRVPGLRLNIRSRLRRRREAFDEAARDVGLDDHLAVGRHMA